MKKMNKGYLMGVGLILVCSILSGCDGRYFEDVVSGDDDLITSDRCADIEDSADKKTCYKKISRGKPHETGFFHAIEIDDN